jgi:hypothetical protein
MQRAPIPGHISSLRAAEQEQKKSSVKDANKKHIDPFTGKLALSSGVIISN